jgi:flagellar hook-associated protein 1
MPSFSTINLALQAILTQQKALEVVEHNVANSATPGYHRQEAILRAGPSQGAPGLNASSMSALVGTGVVLNQVKRYSMEFVDGRYRAQLSETKKYELEQQFVQQVEGAMGELEDSGLNAKLDEFWAAWKAGGTAPSDLTRRADLLEKAKSLASGVSGRAEALFDLQRDQNLAIIQRVEEVNQLAGQIAKINAEIGRYQSPGTQANDFLDESDRLLDRLSEIAGAKVYIEDNGQAMVSIGGHVLVQGTSTHTLVTRPESTNFNLVDVYWEDGQPLMVANGDSTLSSGELAGLREVRDSIIPEQKRMLDDFATQLAVAVNAIHSTGYGLGESVVYDPLNPPAGQLRNFYTILDVNNPALSLRVNADLEDVSKIAFSRIEVPAGAVAGDVLSAAAGDGTVAEEIFRLQTTAQTFPDGTVDTLNHFNTMRASDLGLEVKRITTLATQHKNLYEVLNEQRESVSGVSLDEEAANMLKFQRSYQAAVRLMTAVDEMMQQVVTSLGLVGR